MLNDVESLFRNHLFVIVNDVLIHVRILLHDEYLIHVVGSRCVHQHFRIR
jgi:hypothetical protein